MQWNLNHCSGDPPPATSGTFCGMIGTRMYVTGGRNNTGLNQTDLHVLDLNNVHWNKCVVRGDAPATSSNLTSTVWHDPRQRQEFIVNFSGHPSHYFRSKINVLDPRIMRWTQHEPRWLHPSHPSTYGDHHCGTPWDVATNGPVVFGAEDGAYSDLVLGLDIRMWRWLRIHAGGALPSPRSLHAHVLDEASNALYVFGGFDGEYRNDLYKMDLAMCSFEKIEAMDGSTTTPRSGAQLSVERAGRHFTVHGGCVPGGRVLCDIAVLDLDRTKNVLNEDGAPTGELERDVTWVPQRSSPDLPRVGHTMATWRPGTRPTGLEEASGKVRFVVYGGHDGTQHTNDVYACEGIVP
eukprot:PhM_4_TR1915/c0_g1_i1/m.98617/K20285/RABEPK; Rab9 effector protein with kelch motifs